MMLVRIALKQMVRYWRMNLVVLIGFLLTAVFLSILPSYANAIAGRSLQQQLADVSATARNIRIDGDALNAALYGQIKAMLPGLLEDRVEVFEGNSQNGLSTILAAKGEERPFDEYLSISPWAFSELSQHINIIEGRLPNHIGAVPNIFHTDFEAVISSTTANQINFSNQQGANLTRSHLQIGDEVRSSDETLRVKIVGIVEPIDPNADVWASNLEPFETTRVSLHGANLPETIILSLLMPTASIQQDWPGADNYWRLLIDTDQINMSQIEAVQQGLSQIESELDIELDTALLLILNQFQASLQTAQVTLFLLAAQSLIFVLFTLSLIGSFVADQSRGILATLAGRGFTNGQMTQIFAIQGFILAFLMAMPIAPFLAQGVMRIWGRWAETAVSSTITAESWTLALIAVTFGWLTIVLSIYASTRNSVLQWQQKLARPERWASWQRYYLDFFLLVLGGLIYWQLADTGSLLTQTVANPETNPIGLADPILLLGPSLLLIALALVFLRLFPYLLQAMAWLAQRSLGLILPYGFTKLSRDPTAPSRVLLLISLAAGLTLFANLFNHSLAVRQAEMARYATGADVRMGMPIGTMAVDTDGLSGAQSASLVYRNVRARLARELGRQTEMIAIDPATFPTVAEYPPFISRLTVAGLMPILEETDGEAIPAIFSANSHPRGKEIGDRIEYVVGTHRVEFEVRAIITHFPSMSGPFFITNRALLEDVLDLTVLSQPWVGQKEIWLATEPEQHAELVSQIEKNRGPAGSFLLADTAVFEQELRSNLLAQEVIGAFNLNAFTLAALSVAVFLMVHFFSAQRRMREFSLMRATGLSAPQLLQLLSLEGVIMMVFGLLAGSGIGYGLAVIMRPFLSRTLATAVNGNVIHKIIVDWTAVTGLYSLLILAYAIALTLLLIILLRVGIHRAMQMGEE